MIKQEAIKMISLNDIRKRPELIVYDDEDVVVTRTFKAENINVVRANKVNSPLFANDNDIH